MLRLRLLGELALEIDGRSVEPPSKRRARSLLAWLALERRIHSRSELAGRFWPDVLEESARTSLRGALSVLRRALGPDADRYLVCTRDSIGLAGEPEVHTDLDEFERLIARDELDAALELCTGELLAGLDDDWVYERREQHRSRVGHLLGTLSRRAENDGDPARAITFIRRQIALDPLAEEPQRELMRQLEAAGDRAAALKAYERFSARLREELKIVPSPTTRELAEKLRTGGDQSDDGSPVDTPRRDTHAARSYAPSGGWQPPLPALLSEPDLTPLVGRGKQLARLDHHWRRALGNGPRVVLLEGEPGIGKTRLAFELCRTVHADGAIVLFGRCHEEAIVPYQPFVEALGQYVSAHPPDKLDPQLGEHRRVLANLVPALGDVGVKPERGQDEDDPRLERYRLLDAVSSVLHDAARVLPLLVVLDDLQWAGRPTLIMLRHLMRSPGRCPLMVLATVRPTEPDPEHALGNTLVELRRAHRLERIALDPLSEQDLSSLLAGREIEASAAAVQILHRRTEGNPLFVEEMIHELTETVQHEDWTSALEQASAPESVRDLTGRRLRRLDESCRQTLAAAAIIGSEFDLRLLQTVAGLDEDRLIEQLEQLLAVHILVESQDVGGRFSFTHALVRDAIREQLSRIRTAQLQRRVAQALEAIHADQLDEHASELAHHFTAAGELAKAFEYHRRAADGALATFAAESALNHYSAAIEAAERLGLEPASDPATRGLYLTHAKLRFRLGEASAELRAELQTALAAARASEDHAIALEALNELGFLHRRSDMPGAAEYHESALALAEQIGDLPAQVQALGRLSLIHSNMLELDRALELGEQALARARQAGDQHVLARAMDSLKLAALQLGDLDRLEQLTGELERVQRERNDLWYLQWTLLESGYIPLAAARFKQAEHRFAEAATLNRRLHDQATEPLMHDAFCWLHRSRGDYGQAISAGHRATQTAISAHTWEAWTAATMASALLELRAAPQAIEVLQPALARAEQIGSRNDMLRCLSQLAWARALLGTDAEATELANRAQALIKRISTPPGTAYVYGAHCYAALARAHLATGEPDRGVETLQPLLGAAERSGWLEATATTALTLGLCREQQADHNSARELLGHAAQIADNADIPGAAWEAHAALSRIDHTAGRLTEAEHELNLALDAANRAKASLHDQQLEVAFSDAVNTATSSITAA